MKTLALFCAILFCSLNFPPTRGLYLDQNRARRQLDGFANVFDRLVSRVVLYGQSALAGGTKAIATTMNAFQNLASPLFGNGGQNGPYYAVQNEPCVPQNEPCIYQREPYINPNGQVVVPEYDIVETYKKSR